MDFFQSSLLVFFSMPLYRCPEIGGPISTCRQTAGVSTFEEAKVAFAASWNAFRVARGS
jgi:hypothetical protein